MKASNFQRMVMILVLGVFWGLTLSSTAVFAQQDIKVSLFKKADQALKEAKAVHADILAPKSYSKAMKNYLDADKDFENGKNLEDIRENLSASVIYFNKAITATKLAEVTLINSIKARLDAEQAGAAEFAASYWEEAEEKFLEASGKLEKGDVNAAKKKSGEAEPLFRQAELEAIKVNYLNETWDLLKQADDLNVKKYAPVTLLQAQQLIAKAEKELSDNRYDTDVARSLARQAKYEAKHAIYLHKIVKELRDDDKLLEAHLLATEKPLTQIAETMDIVGSFEAGFEKTTNDIIETIRALQDSAAQLDQNLADRNQQLEMLHARIAEMEETLGGIEKEKSALALKIEAQAKVRAQFLAVEKLFSREEATVLRKTDDIILRLISLSFPVGKAVIEPQNFAMLTKVQQAINMFPECAITIEGYTDSHGSDQKNMELSKERADAVSQYLMANMGLDASRISATGYGESRPIATNETKDGRAKNRRIDVIIRPKL